MNDTFNLQNQLQKMVYEDNATFWKICIFLKCSSTEDYRRKIATIFIADALELKSFRKRIKDNNMMHRDNLKNTSEDLKKLSEDDLIKYAEDGKTNIEIMEEFGIYETSYFNTIVKDIFRACYDYKQFAKRLKENFENLTKCEQSLEPPKNQDSIPSSNISTEMTTPNSIRKSNLATKPLHILAMDVLYKWKKHPNLGIPVDSEDEFYITRFALKFFSDKGDSRYTGNPNGKDICFSAYASNIFRAILNNSNIKLLEDVPEFYEYVSLLSTGCYKNEDMCKIRYVGEKKISTIDNDLLIYNAIVLKRKGEFPVIVTNNVATMENCAEFGIATIPDIEYSEKLDKNIKKLSDCQILEEKNDGRSLTHIYFDTSYIAKNTSSFYEYLASNDSIKVILSCVYEEILSCIYAEKETFDVMLIYNIMYALTYNPTVRFVKTSPAYSSSFIFTDNVILSYALRKSTEHEVIIATRDTKLAASSYTLGLKLEFPSNKEELDTSYDDNNGCTTTQSGIKEAILPEEKSTKKITKTVDIKYYKYGKSYGYFISKICTGGLILQGISENFEDLMSLSDKEECYKTGLQSYSGQKYFKVKANYFVKFFDDKNIYIIERISGENNLVAVGSSNN